MERMPNFKRKLLLSFGALVLSGCLADLKQFSSARSAGPSLQTRAVSDSNSSRSVSSSEKRVALVIGNKAYPHIGDGKGLITPVNDARAISSTLKNLGFEVIYAEDTNVQQMHTLLEQFANKARGSALALFYFAGHGAQYSGENFLIPVDFKPKVVKDTERSAIPENSLHVNQVLTTLEQPGIATRILILDACRNWKNEWGLADIKSSAKFGFGTLIVSSTEPGSKAADYIEETDSNSPFAKALLKYMPQGLAIQVMFSMVQNEVYNTTKGKLLELRGDSSGQSPWITMSPLGEEGGSLCLAPCVETSTSSGTSICKIRVGQGHYDGECRNGIPHGQGVLRYSDGEYYQGNFSNGVRHGRGIQYLTDGTEVRGVWMNGRLQ